MSIQQSHSSLLLASTEVETEYGGLFDMRPSQSCVWSGANLINIQTINTSLSLISFQFSTARHWAHKEVRYLVLDDGGNYRDVQKFRRATNQTLSSSFMT